jgi:hypothetical protein
MPKGDIDQFVLLALDANQIRPYAHNAAGDPQGDYDLQISYAFLSLYIEKDLGASLRR